MSFPIYQLWLSAKKMRFSPEKKNSLNREFSGAEDLHVRMNRMPNPLGKMIETAKRISLPFSSFLWPTSTHTHTLIPNTLNSEAINLLATVLYNTVIQSCEWSQFRGILLQFCFTQFYYFHKIMMNASYTCLYQTYILNSRYSSHSAFHGNGTK